MADLDYAEIAAVAETLIDETGRDVTFIRWDQTEADATKPWKGPSNPRTTPDATDTVKATFVPISTAASSLGIKIEDADLLKRTSQVCLVAPASFDLSTAQEIIDGAVHHRITFVEKLQPADVVLLYYVGVER